MTLQCPLGKCQPVPIDAEADIDPRSLVDQIADYHLSNWARWISLPSRAWA